MRTLRTGFLMALAFGPLAAFPTRAQQVQVSGANRTIAVTATAEAKAKADTAVVHIGYQIYGPTSDAVTDLAGKTSKAIVEALANAGVANDAIESQNQSTGPVEPYQQNGNSQAERDQRRFQAQQSWTVRTSADGASKVLAAATAAGANNSGSIDWSVSDEDTLTAQAAGKAVKDAKAIAEQMASGLGAKLGDLVYASNEAQTVRVMPMIADRVTVDGPPRQMMQKKLSLSPPMVGQSATVSAIFAIQ